MSNEEEQYPSLKKEIVKEENMFPLKYVCEEKAKQIEDDIEKEVELAEKMKDMPNPYRFAGYDPNVIDFIRRCETEEQAVEIIDYLKKKGDISRSTAKDIKQLLSKDGLRSFGEKKQAGFYFQHED